MRVKVNIDLSKVLRQIRIYWTFRSDKKRIRRTFISDSTNVLTELENIDDEADVFKIRFVRIHDLELAEDYSLYYMPSLVYFRSGMPIVYEGI